MLEKQFLNDVEHFAPHVPILEIGQEHSMLGGRAHISCHIFFILTEQVPNHFFSGGYIKELNVKKLAV